MKKILPLLFFSCLTLGTIVSCGPTSTDQITGVEIGGAGNVKIGATIQLFADVIGSDNESVTWTSENEEVATVDQTGLVTGISAGTVDIIAKSTAEPNYFGKKTINVTQELCQDLSIIVEQNEDIVKLNDTTYAVSLGKALNLEVVALPDYTALPDSLSFEIISPNTSISASSYSINYNGAPNKATFISYTEADNFTIKVKGTHTGSTVASIIKSINVNVVDKEHLNRENLIAKLNTFKSLEEKYLSSAEILEKYESSEDNFEKTYFGNVYENTAYVQTNENSNSYYTYSGIHETKERSITNYYAFDYQSNKEISHLYANEVLKENENRHHFIPFSNGNSITYGFTERILNIISGDSALYNDIVTFENLEAYSNSKYSLSDTVNTITSTFVDSLTNTNYELSLEIVFDKNNYVSSYSFEEKATNGTATHTYIEKLVNAKYEERTQDNYDHKIDINYYSLNSFDLVVCNEQTENYDYSNTSKYGPEKVETTAEGLIKYTLPENKTLALKVKNTGTNEHASTLIDRVSGKSANPNVIPNPTLITSDIFVINPYKDNKDNITLGETTLTFTSLLGYSISIVVEFIDAEIESVFTTKVPANNDFGEVFLNRESSYFFINTTPDEDIYTYYLDIMEGNEDGLELFRYEYMNPFNYPGFSYAVRGLKTGSYKFRIGIEGSYIKTEDYYTITIVEPYSREYLIENLVNSNQKFRYTTGTFDAYLTFESETQVKIESHLLGMDPKSATFNVSFETGKIAISSSQTLSTNMYFEHVKEGEIYFNKDLTSLILLLSIANGDTSTEITDSTYFSPFTFDKVIDKSDIEAYINNKSFESEVYVSNKGYCATTLSFVDGLGRITVNKNGTIFEATFNYSYDKSYTTFYLENIIYLTGENLFQLDSQIYYNEYLSRFEFKLYNPKTSDYEMVYFEI